MSETRHTPEPWEIEVWGHELFGVYPNPAGPEGVIARVTEGGAENKANAHRIVACVNACAGIADPSAVPDLLEAATLIDSMDFVEGYTFPASDWPKLWHALTLARAALAKATTKATQ